MNRLDEVIVFHPLSEDHILGETGRHLFRDVPKRIEDRDLTLEPARKPSASWRGRARREVRVSFHLKRAMQKYLEDPFSESLLQGRARPGDDVVVEVADAEHLKFTVRSSAPPLQEEPISREVR